MIRDGPVGALLTSYIYCLCYHVLCPAPSATQVLESEMVMNPKLRTILIIVGIFIVLLVLCPINKWH